MKITKDVKHVMELLTEEKEDIKELYSFLTRREPVSERGDHSSYDDEKIKERHKGLVILKFLAKLQNRLGKSYSDFRSDLKDAKGHELSSEEVDELMKGLPDFPNISFYFSHIKNEFRYISHRLGHDKEVQEHEDRIGNNLEIVKSALDDIEISLQKAAHAYLERVKKHKEGLLVAGKEKKKSDKAELKRRKRALKRLGLKGKISVNLKKANAHFIDRYGISYEDLIEVFAKKVPSSDDVENIKIIRDHMKKYRNKRHIVIFPMVGVIFNYYIAKGMEQEIRREGGKVRVMTIKTFRTDDYKPNLATKKSLDEQGKKILASAKPESYSILDDKMYGQTERQVRYAMGHCKYKGLVNTNEHQMFEIKDLRLSVRSLYKKKKAGVMIPASHDILTYVQHYPDEEKKLQSNISISKIKEMLVTFGRVYWHLSK